MILAEQLSYAYKDGQSSLHFDDFNLHTGQHLLISGPSGCGKSTLIHLLSALIKPTSGKINVYGYSLGNLSHKETDKYRTKITGIVFQEYFLIHALSIWENLVLAQNELNAGHIKELMEQLGISGLAKKKPGQISQGQAQRVAIARALVNKPKLILADEPTAHLDDKNAEKVIRLLLDHANDLEASLVTVTHDQRINGFFENKLCMK